MRGEKNIAQVCISCHMICISCHVICSPCHGICISCHVICSPCHGICISCHVIFVSPEELSDQGILLFATTQKSDTRVRCVKSKRFKQIAATYSYNTCNWELIHKYKRLEIRSCNVYLNLLSQHNLHITQTIILNNESGH